MSRTKIAIALIAGSLALAGAASASEQRNPTGSHHEQHAGNEHAGRGHGNEPTTGDSQSAAGFLSAAAVLDQLGKQGYTAFTDVELDDGKYELEGRDASGRKVEIDVDARTGTILKVEQD